MLEQIRDRFLSKTDETGRFIIYSFRTGISYFCEPLDTGERRRFGDINPATGQVEGSYGQKYRGAIHPKDSLITEENGFKNIVILKPGVSPNGYVNEIDEKRYAEGFRPGVKKEITDGLPGVIL